MLPTLANSLNKYFTTKHFVVGRCYPGFLYFSVCQYFLSSTLQPLLIINLCVYTIYGKVFGCVYTLYVLLWIIRIDHFFSVHCFPKPCEGESYSEKVCPLLFLFVGYWNDIVGKADTFFDNYQSGQRNHKGDKNCHILSDSRFVSNLSVFILILNDL